MSDTAPPILDGHNDVLTRLLEAGGVHAAESFASGAATHVDLAKARRGGLGGGFFALWVASASDGDAAAYQEEMKKASYDLPLPPTVGRDHALHVVSEQIAILKRLEAIGAVRICTTVAAIRDCLGEPDPSADEDVPAGGTDDAPRQDDPDDGAPPSAERPLAAIMHLEGAEAIDPDFHTLEALHAEGLRSLGPVWSRSTIWGEGVPFRFPGSPDTGPGLTDHGIALVRRCNAMNILLDCSHLNEAGFRDVAEHSVHPLVATHSNAHALSAQTRNLTDEQLATIRESEGMVGLNFACAFLREDGRMDPDVPLETVLRHLDHLIAHVGEDGVGLGSDFDGAVVPDAIGDASGVATLREAMRAHGYDEPLLRKLCHGNWLRVLERTWSDPSAAAHEVVDRPPGRGDPPDEPGAPGIA